MSLGPAFSFGTSASSAPTQQQQQQPLKAPVFNFGSSALTSASAAPSSGAPAGSAPAFSFGSPAALSAQPLPAFAPSSLGSLGKPPAVPPLVNPFAASKPPEASSTLSGHANSSPSQKSTRFEDLGDAERKTLLEMEQFIHERVAIGEEMRSRSLGEEIKRSCDDLQTLETRIGSLQTSFAYLRRTCGDLKTRTDTDSSDRVKAQRILDSFAAGKTGGTSSTASQNARSVAGFPHEYFTRQVVRLADRLQTYRLALEQVQSQLVSPIKQQTQAILPSLKAQHDLCLSLAAKIASLHAELQGMRSAYTRMWRERLGSVRDPFEEARLVQAGIGLDSGRDAMIS